MSALGVLLGAASLYLHAVGYVEREDTAYRSERAICAVIAYSEETLDDATSEQRRQNPEGTERFADLIRKMRATGVRCPPSRPSVATP